MNPLEEPSQAISETHPPVPHAKFRPDTPNGSRPTSSKGVLGLVLTALMMAAGSVSLAVFQWVSRSPDRSEPVAVSTQAEPVAAPATKVEPAPVAVEPPPIEPVAPLPAYSEEEIAARRQEAERLEREAAENQAKSQADSSAITDAVTGWKKMLGTAVSSRIAAETAALNRQAAAATVESMNRRYKELTAETAQVLKTPKPPREALSGYSPVAKPAKGQEYHFEVRGDRIAFIDIQQLLELVKKDVQIRMRLSGSPRGIQSEVGPVGDFGLAYEIGPMNDMLGGTGVGLKGWEVVPARDPRGETVERSAQALSEFDRTIRRLSPSSATITMWVYPDGFGTFRIMRDRLHALGFMVAARPLPQDIPVRGSPMGSISAGQ
ncbi:hypothetical protein GC170_15260 [bacterium]|nr:hypothetical protein [bacterium]